MFEFEDVKQIEDKLWLTVYQKALDHDYYAGALEAANSAVKSFREFRYEQYEYYKQLSEKSEVQPTV